MKKFYLMTTAGLLAMAATPATAQVSLPTEPDPLVAVDVDLSTGALLGDQSVLDAVVEVGGGELLDVYLGLLEGSTGGTNFQLLDGTILTALETLGGPELVSAFESLVGTTARTADYVTNQANSASQVSTLAATANSVANVSATAASIGNSYALDAAANVVADLGQVNEGAGTSTVATVYSAVSDVTETAASIGNSNKK